MDFLDNVMEQLAEPDRRLLREILFEPLPSRAEVDQDLDNLRVRQIERELRDAQTCMEDPANAAHRPALLAYQRGLRRLLAPNAPTLRKIFCVWLVERKPKPWPTNPK